MNPVIAPAAPGLTDRYRKGVGPAPKSWELPRAERETTICGNCGEVIWADWRGARHKCKPRRADR